MTHELIPVHQENGELWADARTLHAALQVGRDFSNWIRGRLEEVGAVEGEEFIVLDSSPDLASKRGGHNRRDYWLSLDLAKEVSMLERTEIGKGIRRYFIEAEKQLRAQRPSVQALPDFTDPVIAARAWADVMEAEQRARAELVRAEQEVAALTPQARQFQALISAQGTYSMADAAKILGTGQNRLFDLLRERGILMDKARSGREHHNLPYQPYIDREYFKVVTRPRPDGEALTQTTRVTPKGLAWLQRKMAENNLLPVLPPKGARQQVQA